jgi:hypothetical protein
MIPPVRHIGFYRFMCGLLNDDGHFEATDRTDLSYAEYLTYQQHPFKNESRFRYCKNCLRAIKSRKRAV